MKPNLKDFPNWDEFIKQPQENYTLALADYSGRCVAWKEEFEKQLRQKREREAKRMGGDLANYCRISEILGEE